MTIHNMDDKKTRKDLKRNVFYNINVILKLALL